jgi:hypothetical protein
MDAFDLVDFANINGDYLGLSQYSEADAYVGHFLLGDRMLSSVHYSSFPAHVFSVAATTNGVLDVPK